MDTYVNEVGTHHVNACPTGRHLIVVVVVIIMYCLCIINSVNSSHLTDLVS